MSLAPRHTVAPQNSNHVVATSTAAQNVHHGTNSQIAPAGAARGKCSGRMGGNSFANFLASRLSMPRQLYVQARDARDNTQLTIHLSFTGTIGQGTFGQIEKAALTIPSTKPGSTNTAADESVRLLRSDESAISVAVKRVLQDPRYKNRELSIMQKLSNHPNVVKFFYYYFSTSAPNGSRGRRTHTVREGVCPTVAPNSGMDLYLNLVLECFPESLFELVELYSQRSLTIPPLTVKLFTYQMLKALAYLHSHQICHRDIKSSNLLVNESTLVLKVCDFGSAKEMIPDSTNVSYISSRYYRAPELLFGAQVYTCAIDTWSAGCVLAEMLRQHCLFMGMDSVDQLVKVIRVLGTPTAEDIASMNPTYETSNFPDVQSCPVKLFFPRHTPADLLALMSQMLVYNPNNRLSPRKTLDATCFAELRELSEAGGKLPSSRHIMGRAGDAPAAPCLVPPMHEEQTHNGISP